MRVAVPPRRVLDSPARPEGEPAVGGGLGGRDGRKMVRAIVLNEITKDLAPPPVGAGAAPSIPSSNQKSWSAVKNLARAPRTRTNRAPARRFSRDECRRRPLRISLSTADRNFAPHLSVIIQSSAAGPFAGDAVFIPRSFEPPPPSHASSSCPAPTVASRVNSAFLS